ncbi:MAG TPA: RNA polymerase sigma factor [Flavobacteriales bacterium]|nr:RNA polymerase sigma factor [Flavobacteriales bacterium]
MASDERSAFMQAYEPCHAAFARYCAALAYGRMDVQDLMQDVLLSAFQRFDHIRKKDELLHYLMRAARNRMVSSLRINRRNEAITSKQTERLLERGATAEQLTDAGILHQAINKLPTAQRDALVLFEVAGLSMAEIAAIQGCNENAVKTRVSRARAAVRSMLEGRTKPLRMELVRSLMILLP